MTTLTYTPSAFPSSVGIVSGPINGTTYSPGRAGVATASNTTMVWGSITAGRCSPEAMLVLITMALIARWLTG